MKALKILGGIVVALGLGVAVFWLGWLRAPPPEDVCAHMAEIVKSESGVALPGAEQSRCVARLQPPEFGRMPYVARMKCMNDAETSAELRACE